MIGCYFMIMLGVAWWAMIVGFAMGIFRMAIDTPITLSGNANFYEQGSLFWVINNINFQYFSILILITLVSAVVMVGVSMATPPPDAAQIVSLTFGTQTDADRVTTKESRSVADLVASAAVMAAIIFAYIYFTG